MILVANSRYSKSGDRPLPLATKKVGIIVFECAAKRAAEAAAQEEEGSYQKREVDERLKRTFPLALVRPLAPDLH